MSRSLLVLLMQWLLLVVVVLAGCEAAGSVGSECAHVPENKRNDEFCDCPEGSTDEGLTSACAPKGSFTCPRLSKTIPSSRVNDGICDCCDGADEKTGGRVSCEDLCAAEERRVKEEAERDKQARKGGEAQFLKLVEQVRLSECERNAKAAQVDPDVERRLNASKARLDELESRTASVLMEKRIAALRLDRLSHEDLARVVVKLVHAKKKDLTSKVEEFVGDVLQCGSRSEREDDDSESEAEECEGGNPHWMADDEHEENETEVEELAKLRTEVAELQTQFDAQHGAEDDDAGAGEVKSYGPGSAWKALRKQCVSLFKEKYNYQVCFFGKFTQDETSLGVFSAFSPEEGTMSFSEGDACYSVGPRSVKVLLGCGDETKLLDVYEPSTCMYEARVVSPAACVPEGFREEGGGECSSS